MRKFVAGIALATAFAAGSSQATTIYPVSAIASSFFTTYEAGFAIDQGANSANTDWAAGSTGAGTTLDLNLGALYFLTAADVTQRVTSGGPNGAFFGGLSDFTSEFSLQGFSNSTFTTAITGVKDVTVTNSCQNSPACFLTVVSLGGGGPAIQYVQYTVVATSGVNPGISDIHFDGDLAATPLPSTWLMLLSGFVGLGLFAYRGTKKNAVALAGV